MEWIKLFVDFFFLHSKARLPWFQSNREKIKDSVETQDHFRNYRFIENAYCKIDEDVKINIEENFNTEIDENCLISHATAYS